MNKKEVFIKTQFCSSIFSIHNFINLIASEIISCRVFEFLTGEEKEKLTSAVQKINDANIEISKIAVKYYEDIEKGVE